MERIKNNQFYIFIVDILNYLSKYIDVTEISKVYKDAEYILTDNAVNEIKLENGKSYEIKIGENTGETVVPMVLKSTKFYFSKQICFVRNKENADELKNTMFHELMHVGSTKKELLGRRHICLKTGLYSNEYICCENNKKYLNLNEAMTEFVAKFIYDDLYDETYKIVRKLKDGYRCSIYERSYFVLAFLLSDYFESNPKELFEIYFNNNLELLDSVLRKNTIYTLETLDNLINMLQERDDYKVQEYYENLIKKLFYSNPIRNKEIVKQYNL